MKGEMAALERKIQRLGHDETKAAELDQVPSPCHMCTGPSAWPMLGAIPKYCRRRCMNVYPPPRWTLHPGGPFTQVDPCFESARQ